MEDTSKVITADMLLQSYADRPGPNPMPKAELITRLNISLGNLQGAYKEFEAGMPRTRGVEKTVIRVLWGVLLRLMQREEDKEIRDKIEEIFRLSLEMVGV